MALIVCPECNNKVSEYADKCPSCGCPMEIIKRNASKEQTPSEYRRVILQDPGVSKVNTIKCVREITNLGLKEAKILVDTAPQILVEGVTEQDAINLQKMFASEGAILVIERDYNSTERNEVFSKLKEQKVTSVPPKMSNVSTTKSVPQKDANMVHCPYCNSTNVNRISSTKKAASIIGFGILSNKIGKQWHCNNCRSDF